MHQNNIENRAGGSGKPPKEKNKNLVGLSFTDSELAHLKEVAGLVPLATYVKHRLKTDTDIFQKVVSESGEKAVGTQRLDAVAPQDLNHKLSRTSRHFSLQSKHHNLFDAIVFKMKRKMKGPELVEQAIELLAEKHGVYLG